MPYSRNPLKYPDILHEILAHLMTARPSQLTLECATPAEAQSRRIQMHSFFRAIERHAQEMTVELRDTTTTSYASAPLGKTEQFRYLVNLSNGVNQLQLIQYDRLDADGFTVQGRLN